MFTENNERSTNLISERSSAQWNYFLESNLEFLRPKQTYGLVYGIFAHAKYRVLLTKAADSAVFVDSFLNALITFLLLDVGRHLVQNIDFYSIAVLFVPLSVCRPQLWRWASISNALPIKCRYLASVEELVYIIQICETVIIKTVYNCSKRSLPS